MVWFEYSPISFHKIKASCVNPPLRHVQIENIMAIFDKVSLDKNSAEVDIAPAFGEITTACNVGQAKKGSWCVLEEWTTSLCKVSYSQPSLLQRNVL